MARDDIITNLLGRVQWVWALKGMDINDIHLVKGAPIAVGGALQVLGSGKLVVQSGDALKIKSDTASSVDAWVSAVDDISS